jgi:tetratricopeptide (TPR) repeat protein
VRVIELMSISGYLASALQAGGVDAMAAAYREFKTDPETAGLFTEVEVNGFAYTLMGSGNLPAATKAFELNAESYPNSWNAWDSLAEAHMNAGNDARAIELYEKSLILNPANANAEQMIEKIRDGGTGR